MADTVTISSRDKDGCGKPKTRKVYGIFARQLTRAEGVGFMARAIPVSSGREFSFHSLSSEADAAERARAFLRADAARRGLDFGEGVDP